MTQRESEHPGHSDDSGSGELDAGAPGGTGHSSSRARSEIALRGPAELADALPYLLGFYPDDSIVVVALHGARGRFGGRIRIGIPAAPEEWGPVSGQIAACLADDVKSGGRRPDGAVVFLCQDPAQGESGKVVMERLRPLAQALRTACGEREMPVYEALCISASAFWSYCCPDGCCPVEGRPASVPGTSAMAAAAAYAGVQVRGSLREMERRLTALGSKAAHAQQADAQRKALDSASSVLVPRMLAPDARAEVAEETLGLAATLLRRFRGTEPEGEESVADAHDDGLLSHADAATVILGLQDRRTRDQAAEWMEGPDVGPALRLWRALARRCVAPYTEHAAAPLTLAGWVAWSGGDESTARVALDCALRSDPDYVFAQLLHRAFNDGMDPEPLRRCMRKERADRGTGVGCTHTDPAPRSVP